MNPLRLEELSRDQLRQLDLIVSQFESGLLSSGGAREIESHLTDVGPAIQPTLLTELLVADVEYQTAQGNEPRPDDYRNRFPQHGPLVDEAFRRVAQAALESPSRQAGGSDANASGEGLLMGRVNSGTGSDAVDPKPADDDTLEQTQRLSAGDTEPSLETIREPIPAADDGLQNPAAGTDSTPALPAEVGRYRIQRLLGRGGMGTVYLAEDTELDRRVALKIPHLNHADETGAIRFRREARAMATLQHPNLCPVYDVGEVDGRQFMTMAYIEGPSLSQVLKQRQRLPAAEAAGLVRRLATAVEFAHQAGIVHRDLKPANVMINALDEPVVMDFGLARRERSAEESLTQEGMIVGSPAYMAPEQVGGDASQIGPQADVYALGVMLYEMLCGERPYSGSAMTVLSQIMTQPPRKLTDVRPDVDPRLADICSRALARNPGDRYASAGELAAELDGWSAEQSAPTVDTVAVSARRELADDESTAQATTEAISRHNHSRRRTTGWIAAIAVPLLVALAVYVFNTPDGRVTVYAPDDAHLDVELRQGGRLIKVINRAAGWTASIDEGEYQISLNPRESDQRTTFKLVGSDTLVVTGGEAGEIRIVKDDPMTAPDGEESSHNVADQGEPRSRPPVPDPLFTDAKLAMRSASYYSAVAGDFDGDGRPDVLACSCVPDPPVIYWGDSEWKSTPLEADVPLDNAWYAAAGDLDGDGDLDLFLSRAKRRSDLVLLNNGQGGFQSNGQSLGERESGPVKLGDLDGDGDLDAWVTIRRGGNAVWFNDGQGQFTRSEQNLPGDFLHRSTVSLADFDADGDLDAITLFSKDGTDQAHIHWNDGSGRFEAGDALAGLADTGRTTVADLNQDGLTDLVAVIRDRGVVACINQQGTWKQEFLTGSRRQHLWDVIVSDFNGDSFPDIVVSTAAGPGLGNWVWLNQGHGTFGDPIEIETLYATMGLVAADFDGDGDNDLFEANRLAVSRLLLSNVVVPRETGDSHQAGSVEWSGAFEVRELPVADTHGTVADVDNDGDPDLIFVDDDRDDSGHILLNDGHGGFTDAERSLPQAGGVVAHDVDADGDLDLWLLRRKDPDLVLFNDGHGVFADSGQQCGGLGSYDVALADFDGDGDPDAYLASGSGHGDLRHAYNRVLLNDGHGMFVDTGQKLVGGSSRSAVAVDVDADGDLDVCVGNTHKTPNCVWLNDGAGRFERGQELDHGALVVVAGDVDADGDIDLVFGKGREPSEVWFNNGTGVFSLSDPVFETADTKGICLVDLDGDSDLDVVVGNRLRTPPNGRYDPAPNAIWWNAGDGRFTSSTQLPGASQSWQLLPCDVDADGDIDLLETVSRDGAARLLINLTR